MKRRDFIKYSEAIFFQYLYATIVNLYNGLLETKEFDFGNDVSLRLGKVFMLF